MSPRLLSHGLWIVFEGGEGAGKSTLIQALAALLRQEGFTVTTTREPGGTALAEQIRQWILTTPMDPRTELFLYEAARAEHLAQTIRPALERREIVLCDRFTASTLAYQASARGLPWQDVKRCNQIATSGLSPHLWVFLQIDPKKGLQNASTHNRFEKEGTAFHQRVLAGYQKAIRENPKQWITIRALSSAPDVMAKRLWEKIKAHPRSRKRLKTLRRAQNPEDIPTAKSCNSQTQDQKQEQNEN